MKLKTKLKLKFGNAPKELVKQHLLQRCKFREQLQFISYLNKKWQLSYQINGYYVGDMGGTEIEKPLKSILIDYVI